MPFRNLRQLTVSDDSYRVQHRTYGTARRPFPTVSIHILPFNQPLRNRNRVGGVMTPPYEAKNNNTRNLFPPLYPEKAVRSIRKRGRGKRPWAVENPLRGFPTGIYSLLRALAVRQGAQLAHLQPDRYFLSGTRPDRKCFEFLCR